MVHKKPMTLFGREYESITEASKYFGFGCFALIRKPKRGPEVTALAYLVDNLRLSKGDPKRVQSLELLADIIPRIASGELDWK